MNYELLTPFPNILGSIHVYRIPVLKYTHINALAWCTHPQQRGCNPFLRFPFFINKSINLMSPPFPAVLLSFLRRVSGRRFQRSHGGQHVARVHSGYHSRWNHHALRKRDGLHNIRNKGGGKGHPKPGQNFGGGSQGDGVMGTLSQTRFQSLVQGNYQGPESHI